MESDLAIKTENLTKIYKKSFWRYASKPALESLTLEVPRQSVFGFLGPNGAGKTTTIRCLMDLIRPSSGKAWVLGKPSRDIEVRQRVGYLPDSPAFGTHLSAYQFLKTCSRLLKIPDADAKLKIDEVLDIVRMEESRNDQLSGFSRGMLQRIGIAQALLNDPELLILDEPLVGLDPVGRKELLDIVRDRKEHGVCIFFCSHILSDVATLCDRVGILKEGQLKAVGPLDELLGTNGMSLHVPKENEAFAGVAMMQADNSHRDRMGHWVLEFDNMDKFETLKAQGIPQGVDAKPKKESLEDLFFRVTQNAPEEPEESRESE